MKPVFALAAALSLAGALILSACGGGSSSPTTSAAISSPAAVATSAPTTSAAATATSSSAATPSAVSTATVAPTSSAGTASPTTSTSASASPATGPQVSGPVDLATAYSNLESQGSYQMTAQIQNLPGVLSVVPGITPSNSLMVEVSNNDRHVAVENNSGTKIAELWKVGDQVWASAAGSPPVQADANTAVVGALVPLALADQQLITTFEAQGATYTVTGSEDIDGVATQVETASYQINPSNNIFLGNGPYTVNSTLWVAKSGGYLVQALMQLSQGAGTPTTSSPSVKINVTQVGQTVTITPPSS